MTHDSGPPSIPSRHRGRDGPFQQRDGAPIHGEQGVLKTDGQTVVCGLCGRSFKALGPHVLRRHDLSATEYRDWLGLKASTGLVSPELRQRQRQQSAHLAPYRGAANASSLRGLTPEGVDLHHRL